MTDGKLDFVRLQKIVRERVKMNVSLDEIKMQCEATGAFADKLTTCSETATFAQCVFVKVRNLVMQLEMNEFKGNSDASTNIDKSINSNTNTHPNGVNVAHSSSGDSVNINDIANAHTNNANVNTNANANTNINHNTHAGVKNEAKQDAKSDAKNDANTNVNVDGNTNSKLDSTPVRNTSA